MIGAFRRTGLCIREDDFHMRSLSAAGFRGELKQVQTL